MGRYKRVYLLKKKSEVFARFKEYVAEAECELGVPVRQLRDDKGGEYISTEFNQYCKDRGISRQHTVKATPQQNAVAEHLNQTLAEGAIAMLNQANLPIIFWGQAVLYLTSILNVTPLSSISETTSYEVWKKCKPNLNMYRIFGCRAFVHVQKKDRGPLESRTAKCIFIGFDDGYKGWKVYNPITRKVSISWDVIFNESSFPGMCTTPSEGLTGTLPPHTLWIDKGGENDMTDPLDDQDTRPLHTPSPDAPEHDLTQDNVSTGPDGPSLDTPPDSNEPPPIESSSTQETMTVDSPDVPTHHMSPLIAQGNRPICSTCVLDYAVLDGRTRCTTCPVPRRQPVPEAMQDDSCWGTVSSKVHTMPSFSLLSLYQTL